MIEMVMANVSKRYFHGLQLKIFPMMKCKSLKQLDFINIVNSFNRTLLKETISTASNKGRASWLLVLSIHKPIEPV